MTHPCISGVLTAFIAFGIAAVTSPPSARAQEQWEEAAGFLTGPLYSTCMEFTVFALDPCLYGQSSFTPTLSVAAKISGGYYHQWVRIRGPVIACVTGSILQAQEMVLIDAPTATPTPSATATPTATPPACARYDFNSDQRIDWQDIGPFSGAYGSSCGRASYDARADANSDCVVNWQDIGPFSQCYGSSW